MMKTTKPFLRLAALLLSSIALVLMACSNPAGDDGGGDPEITGFTFTAAAGLYKGGADAAIDGTAGAFSAPAGGTAPFTYTLVTGSGDTDNGSFTVDGTSLKVGAAALTAVKPFSTYSVRVQISEDRKSVG
jgi:hypothetical protein